MLDDAGALHCDHDGVKRSESYDEMALRKGSRVNER